MTNTNRTPVDVDVLIIGGGAAGLSASMLLSSYGISTHLVSRYPKTSNLPKAHVVSIKTMEAFYELGLDEKIRERSTPPEMMRYASYSAGFAGPHEDYGRPLLRLPAWGCGQQETDWLAASKVQNVNLMQSQLEPLLKARAEETAHGEICFYHNFVSFEENEDGIVATLEDRETEEQYTVNAKYMLACDGGRAVGPTLGVELEGHLGVATSISLHFSADLSKYYRDTESLATSILNPDTGVPCVLVPMGPDVWGAKSREWLVHLISFAGDHKAFDDEETINTMVNCLGLPDLNPEVHVINRWPLDAVVANKFREGRVFFLGDAAHRVPPAGGHGLNMAVQDAYNLCWKLSSVLRGNASESLLDSYESERRPLAQELIASTFKGWAASRQFVEAIGFSPKNSPEENWKAMRTVWEESEAGDEVRQKIKEVVPAISPNYESLNTGFGYHYENGALVPDGTPDPGPQDTLGIFKPTSRPGHTVPHTYFHGIDGRHAVADIVGSGKFVLIAGDKGESWCEAARAIASEQNIPLEAFTVGTTAGDWNDVRNVWAELREHGPAGAILVRPDRFVAWRSQGSATTSALEELKGVFNTLGFSA